MAEASASTSKHPLSESDHSEQSRTQYETQESRRRPPQPSPVSKSKGKARQPRKPRNQRNLTDPDELRGVVQSLEERLERSDQSMKLMMDLLTSMRSEMSSFRPPSDSPLSPPPGSVQPEREVLSSIEVQATRSQTIPPVARQAMVTTPPNQDRFETPNGSLAYLAKTQTNRTPLTDPLNDGKDPTFRQWKASIRDRLEVNSEQYPTERSRKALVWGMTKGLARNYLEPQYLSDTATFATAEEMVDLLASYFLTGTESETARNEFHDLQMRDKSNPNETFPEFKARFQSAAIKGNVSKSEWFFYMWEKLYHPLQIETRGLKMNWNGSYDAMVKHLTFIEMERQRSFGKSASRSQTDKKTTTTANSSTPRTTSKPSSLGSKPNPTIT